MSLTPAFSIIIPAHNEESRIGAVLRDYASEFSDSEIIVVLNGCTDGTDKIVEAVSHEFTNISRIEIDAAVGKGGAVRAGFLLARAPCVGYTDADGATSASEFRRMCDQLGTYDGIIGSRWLRGSRVIARQPLQRRVASRIFNACVRLLFGLPFKDTQCGAKVFSAKALRESLQGVETSNLAFDVDLLYHLRERGSEIREVPIEWHDRIGSKVGLVSASPKMLSAIIRLRLRYSLFRILIPWFDRLFPTHPLRVHHNLRILLLNWRDPKHPRAGGAETYLHEMAKRWVSAGHHVEWLTARPSGSSKHEVIDGIKVTRVGNRATVYGAIPLEYLKNHRDFFDVIVDAENGLPFFSPLYSLKPKILLMFHVHRPVFIKHMPPGIGHIFAFFETRVMPLLYRGVPFVAISADTKAQLMAHRMTDGEIDVVYSGVDSRCAPGRKSDRPSILYVGRLQRYKRVDLLLTAMCSVLKIFPDAQLLVAGAGDEESSLRELRDKLNLGDAVHFLGYVEDVEKLELMRSAWVFASASSMEGWGITAAEALASGTPAVVFDVPGLREVVTDGLNGYVVPEAGDIAAALVRILGDPNLRSQFSEAALESARDFSWNRAAQDMLDILARVSAERYSLVRNGEGWTLITRSGVRSPRGVRTNTTGALRLHPISLPESSDRPVQSVL